MSTTNRDAVSDIFKATHRRIVWGNHCADIHSVADETIAWDGAAPTTTGAVYIAQQDVFCYVEIRETGRGERTHAGGVFGMKALMRFTGADDSGEWLNAVVISADTVTRALNNTY